MSDDAEPAAGFEVGDRVEVRSGTYLGDHGIVIRPPVDMQPDYVLVQLVRAHVMRYLPVERLAHKT